MRSTTRLAEVVAIVLVLVLATALLGCIGPKVPDVVGMKASDAIRTLQEAGYPLGETRQAYTAGAAAGTVFQQSPLAGTRLSEGEPVSITVATPLGEFVVPGVTGKTAEEASATIAAASLTPVRVDEYSDTVAVGTVAGQVPAAGAKVDLHANVAYVVSRGKAPATVAVPDIVGKKQSDADAAIKKVGLKPAPQKAYSDSVAKDVVSIQSPAAGASVKPGSTVSYVVSLGKPTTSVTVPAVIGKSEAAAVEAVKAAGLAAQVYRQPDSSVPKGTVVEQMPPAGSKTAPGGVVGILVSLGADSSVSVPAIAGQSSDAAKAAVEAAGLVPYPVEQPSADVPKGSVIQQLPVAGSLVPAGSAVLYAVSTGTPG